ncbi:MAG: class I SAM-dependent methyltransferase [Chloroflexota bacterium]
MADHNNVKDIVQQGYDQVAQDYARLEGDITWPRMKWLNVLLEELEPGASVLDLGCGSGDPVAIEVAKNYQVTGVDISETHIEMARKQVPGGTFLHGDVGSMVFPQDSFEAVVSCYTLEHIPRKEHQAILHRINQWLKHDGYLLLSIEAEEYEDEVGEWLGVPMFLSCYDPETMKQMVIDADFAIIQSDIEIQIEGGTAVPYLWILGRKT